jgi:hypothetical protein
MPNATWAYDRTSHIGKLDKPLGEAESRGWVVVDMKSDWTTIYPPEKNEMAGNVGEGRCQDEL